MLYPEYHHSHLRDNIIPTLLSQGSHGYEITLLRKGGKEFTANVSLSVLKNDEGEIYGMIGYTLDVTEKKLARQALADSERRLADIIDFLPDPTWVIDLNHRVLAWNKAIERMTNIMKDEIIGKADYAYAVPFYGKPRPVLIDLILRRDEELEKEYLIFKEKESFLFESLSLHPSTGNDERYFSETAAMLFNAKGDIVGAIEIIRDVTDYKRSEEEKERLIAELQDAISKVKLLSGMLPICASCKKIRDDTGYWNQIESYIHRHSEAEFSHSICPECAKELYPEFNIKKD
jgi:PAS domain S-box-containing protein